MARLEVQVLPPIASFHLRGPHPHPPQTMLLAHFALPPLSGALVLVLALVLASLPYDSV